MVEFMKNKNLTNKVMPSSGVYDEENLDNENITKEKNILRKKKNLREEKFVFNNPKSWSIFDKKYDKSKFPNKQDYDQ